MTARLFRRCAPAHARGGWRDPAVAFLRIGLPFGLAFALLMPPFTPPDENRHLTRAYLISEGRWAPPGAAPWARASIPRAFGLLQRAVRTPGRWFSRPLQAEDLATLFRVPLRPEERLRVVFAGVYSPLPYLPAAAGIALGRVLRLPAAAVLLLGRIASLTACLGLTALAIRRMPCRGWALAVLALAPMNLAQFAAVSADGLTAALAFLFAACALEFAFGSGARSPSQVGVSFAGLGLLLGLAKPGYAALALLPLAGAARDAPTRRLAFAACAASLGALLLGNAASLGLARLARVPPASPVADAGAQLRVIIASPLAFLLVCARTLGWGVGLYSREIVGYFGYVEAPLPGAVDLAYAGLLLAAIATDGREPADLTLRGRIVLLGVFAAGVLSVLLLAYLGWNAPGASYVHGLQGRYFVPLLPVLLVACPSFARFGRLRERETLFVLGSVVILACALEVVVVHFYRF